VASLSQGRTAAAQCGFFTHKSVPVIFEPPCKLTSVFTLTMKNLIYTLPHRFYKTLEKTKGRESYVLNSDWPQITV